MTSSSYLHIFYIYFISIFIYFISILYLFFYGYYDSVVISAANQVSPAPFKDIRYEYYLATIFTILPGT